jgi:hypothetical protein
MPGSVDGFFLARERVARMIRRSSLVYGLVSVALLCGWVSAGVLARPGSAAAATVPGVWQSPEQVPGLAKLNAGHNAQIAVVSCTGPGDCAGAGSYTDGAGSTWPFVADERGGVWGAARKLPGTAFGPDATVAAISCSSPGNCAVGGGYGPTAWIADEVGGVWGDTQILETAAAGPAGVTSISCVKPGFCAAGGTYSVGLSGGLYYAAAFVASEAHGTWSVASPANLASIAAVSCGSAGNCVAVIGGTLITETAGTWGSPQGLPIPNATAVSCEPSGCDMVGDTGSPGEGLAVTETGGSWGSAWGKAVALPLPVAVPTADVGSLVPQSVSCTAPGDCTAVGDYQITTSGGANIDREGVTISEVGGTWGAPQVVPSLASLDTGKVASIGSVSCRAPGDCAAVAQYKNHSGTHVAVLSQTGGSWGTAQPLSKAPGQTVSWSISCGAVAYCSVGGGSTTDGKHYQAIVADQTPVLPTSATESLSARSVIYGREQAERVSVKVSAALGIAAGSVAVTSAGTPACTITLADGKGSCTIPAAKFGAGRHELTARYRGAPGFAISSAAARAFSVERATSKTTLTLSAATVGYGHEQAAKLTVKVRPQYAGTPGGVVDIMAGRARICVVILNRGTGSCRLGARTLGAGTYQVQAAYGGNADFKWSASASKSLTVTP